MLPLLFKRLRNARHSDGTTSLESGATDANYAPPMSVEACGAFMNAQDIAIMAVLRGNCIAPCTSRAYVRGVDKSSSGQMPGRYELF